MAAELNTEIPCYGFDKEKLFILDPWKHFRSPIEKDRSISQCPVFEWRKDLEDVRHSKLELNVTYGNLLRDNGVFEALTSFIPNESESTKESAFKWSKRDEIEISVITRKRYRWDISCERN